MIVKNLISAVSSKELWLAPYPYLQLPIEILEFLAREHQKYGFSTSCI